MSDIAEINGLVLAGGQSRRMGQPKELIRWHGKVQQYHLADQLSHYCSDVFISCRKDQLINFDQNYQFLTDTFSDMGPFGGLMAAFQHQNNVAWLIVACDMPLLDDKILEHLIQSRNPECIATVYKNPTDGLPEPLIGIWEPRSFPVLEKNFSTGNTSLRKILMKHPAALVRAENPDCLMNANTPEDVLKVIRLLNQSF